MLDPTFRLLRSLPSLFNFLVSCFILGIKKIAMKAWGFEFCKRKCLIFSLKDLRWSNLIRDFMNEQKRFSFIHWWEVFFSLSDWRYSLNECMFIGFGKDIQNKAAIGGPDSQLDFDMDEFACGALSQTFGCSSFCFKSLSHYLPLPLIWTVLSQNVVWASFSSASSTGGASDPLGSSIPIM